MSEKIIEVGIIFLLMYTPLALGGRSEGSIALLEIVSGILLFVWLAKTFSQRKRPSRRRRGKGKNTKKGHRKMYRLQIIPPPLTWALCLFCGLILLQLIPFPEFLVNILSPGTYRLYAEGASYTASALPNRLFLSVCAYATETESYKFLAYIAVFLMMINTIRSPEQIKRLVYIIIAIGLFEAIYGFSKFSGKTSPFISGTFVNKNHFAGYLEMVIPLAFGILFARLEERGPSPFKKFIHLFEEKYLKALLVLFILFVMIAAHLLTGSRGGMISFSLGMLFFCLLVYTRRLFRKWVLVVLIFVLLALGTAVMTSPEIILERLGTLAKPETEQSFLYRWGVWKSTILIFRDFPIIGSGLGTFSHIFRRYQRFPSDLFFTYTENDYLQLLTETGIVGALLILGVGLTFFYRTLEAWKRQRSRWIIAITAGGLSAMFSLCVHSWVDFNLHIPSNALLFSVIAAISYSAAHAQKEEAKRSRKAVSSQQSAFSNQHPASSHPYRAFKLRRSSYYSVIIVAFMLVLLYLFRVAESFYAFTDYQQFRDNVALIEENYVTIDPSSPDQNAQITSHAKKAIQHDNNHADYYYVLGSYLYRYYKNIHDSEQHELREQGFREAEVWMQQAVMRDPANPWYYYELGRLSASRGDCEDPDGHHLEGDAYLVACPTTRYFEAALKNAPNNLFLRVQSAFWYYRYDQKKAFQLIQEIVSMDPQNTSTIMEGFWQRTQDYNVLKKFLPDTPEIMLEFSKFLYDKQLDYESELEAKHTLLSLNSESGECMASSVLQDSPDNKEVELGNDDGSAEWRTYLASKTVRVKKVLCLPENLDEYNYTALKIFMNSGVPGEFIAHISINEYLIKRYEHTIPHDPRWHEIPFDKTLLQGKSSINVYVRVMNASASGNFLNIWGDQDTPTTRSVFNFDTIGDLSFDKGIQTGEYMIRLVLKKL